jgi:uncharacterized protein YutE (UPF0331/DUF86 family)
MVNKEMIKRKISLIQDEMVNLEKLAKFSLQEIIKDFLKQAALERILERIIVRAIDINQHLIAELSTKGVSPPKDYKETFLKLAEVGVFPKEFAKRISKSVGTRNILVHEYNKVDYSKIYSSVSECLKDYHRYCEYILRFLEKI